MKRLCAITSLLICLATDSDAFAQDPVPTVFQGAVFQGSGSSYATMMRQRLRRDSILAAMRGGAFTAEHLRTAYRDSMARRMVAGARIGRLRQDSALVSYDAHGYERVSVGAKTSAEGRERVLQRTEIAARIRWQRGKGVVIDAEGLRAQSGLFAGSDIEADLVRGTRSELSLGRISVPYFPGREELWLGGTNFGFAYNAPVLLHPFADEAEAHYTYATGDSTEIILPDGKSIHLRELRVTPRKAHWTLVVGSFWFDESNFRIVRAAYRPSDIVDAWQYGEWSEGGWGADEEQARAILGAILTPFRATVTSITIEYGLFEGRFWLPRQQTASGEIRASFARFPVEIVEKFEYSSVNSDEHIPVIPANALWAVGDSLWALDSLAYHGDTTARRIATETRERIAAQQRERSAALAAARRAADSTRRAVPPDTAAMRIAIQQRAQITLEQRAQGFRYGCNSDTAHTSVVVRNRRTGLGTLVNMPCSDSLLANSPYLPAAVAINSKDALGGAEMFALAQRLDMGLQAGFGFRLPALRYGFGDSLTRYNRIEGFSPALGAREVIGRGFALDALGRIGTAHGVFEGELSLTRSNARQNLQVAVYRRLNTSNDWGDPFAVGALLQALIFGRDEGFYYRSRGVSFVASAPGNPSVQMKVFAERQLSANADAQFSLGHSLGGATFNENIVAESGNVFGAALQLSHSIGSDPEGFRVFTRIRAEDAMGDFAYARGLLDMTFSHGLFGIASGALTLSAGSSMGDVPVQRMFFLGGSHTVRGQSAGAAVGDAFWMGRLELGTAAVAAKPVVFADLGWAGSRSDWSSPGRPLSGVGVGALFLDGMIRFDLARGLFPGQHVRFAMYLDSRF